MPRAFVWLRRLGILLCFGVALLSQKPAGAASPRVAPPLVASAAATATASGTARAPEQQSAPDSPRAALSEFNRLTRTGDYDAAARYLDLSVVVQSDGPELAKRLRDVLDRHLRLEVDRGSAGTADDGPAPTREELGNVPGAAGKPEPVVMVRRVDRNGPRWLFSADTVARIDGWYDHLENRWLLERLPNWSLRFGPRELRWWQWTALAPLLLLAFLVGFLFTRLLRAAIGRVFSAETAKIAWRLRGPATLAWTLLACYALVPWLGLYEPADSFVRRVLSAAFLVALFWALWKAVDLSQHAVSSAAWANSSHTGASLLMLGTRMGKLLVAAFASVAVLAELGYPVTSIIAGLGIGGIALALAAQKTVENLFGAFSLAIDQPFREGDFIQIDGASGTVIAIGLRSTRLRTVERTLVSIPNGKLAEMRIETITARDGMRFYCVVGLAHAPAQQVKHVIEGIEGQLRGTEAVREDTISVRLVGLTDSAMNVEIVALLALTDQAEFLERRQALLLAIVAVIDESGAGLAHPVSSFNLSEPVRAQLGQLPQAAGPKAD